MTKLNNEYFTRKEILTDLLDTVNYLIENGGNADTEQMFNDTFNTDYYIIGTYEAKQALEQYGVFEALSEVISYQLELNGSFPLEFVKDLSNPEKLANIFYYSKAELTYEELGLPEEEELDHEQLIELKKKIKKELN